MTRAQTRASTISHELQVVQAEAAGERRLAEPPEEEKKDEEDEAVEPLEVAELRLGCIAGGLVIRKMEQEENEVEELEQEEDEVEDLEQEEQKQEHRRVEGGRGHQQ